MKTQLTIKYLVNENRNYVVKSLNGSYWCGHCCRLVLIKPMKQQCLVYRRHFFATRVVNILELLPEDIVNFSTLCSFKNSLNSVDFSRFSTCSWLFCVFVF